LICVKIIFENESIGVLHVINDTSTVHVCRQTNVGGHCPLARAAPQIGRWGYIALNKDSPYTKNTKIVKCGVHAPPPSYYGGAALYRWRIYALTGLEKLLKQICIAEPVDYLPSKSNYNVRHIYL